MTDLNSVLPQFATTNFSHLLPSLDKSRVSTADLLTLDAIDVAKRAQLPPAEVTKLTRAVTEALQKELGIYDASSGTGNGIHVSENGEGHNGKSLDTTPRNCAVISTLDENLDTALAGGFPTGYLTEITGESGAGKTQALLTLLLSVQLPAPHGLSRSAVYISTEAALSTSRLNQLLRLHPLLSQLPSSIKPSLSRVLSIQVPDLESQEHILRYQLPVAIKRQDVSLVVIDSIASNYRAEFERPSNPENGSTTPLCERDGYRKGARSMAERRSQLILLGAYLRDLARTENVAIVVANQVADRFSPASGAPISQPGGAPHSTPVITADPLTLDHQQRWFTGWGDLRDYSSNLNLKTPSLGLVWANQIAARIALIKGPNSTGEGKRRRWFRVVFATWCGPTEGRGIEYEIAAEGLRSVKMLDSGGSDG